METNKINKHNKEKDEQYGTPQKNNIQRLIYLSQDFVRIMTIKVNILVEL